MFFTTGDYTSVAAVSDFTTGDYTSAAAVSDFTAGDYTSAAAVSDFTTGDYTSAAAVSDFATGDHNSVAAVSYDHFHTTPAVSEKRKARRSVQLSYITKTPQSSSADARSC